MHDPAFLLGGLLFTGVGALVRDQMAVFERGLELDAPGKRLADLLKR